MNNKVTGTLAFLAGAALGSFVTWKLVKDRYAKIADEEIKSVIEEFRADTKKKEDDVEPEDETPAPKVDPNEYQQVVNSLGYTNHSEAPEKPHIRIISPESFGEDYVTESLTYYADHVLTYDDDTLVENIDATVGLESLEHFGEFEDDSVHVRNDRLQIDYEILLDTRNYSDVVPNTVHPENKQ